MTQIPMFIIYELEIRKSELLLNESRKLIKNRFCPMTYKNDELINIPSHTASRYLCVIAFELCIFVFCLSLEILFGPHLTMQVRVVDKGNTFVSRFLNHLRCYFLFTYSEKRMILWVIPKDAYRRHLLIEGFHAGHLVIMFFFCELSHNGFSYMIYSLLGAKLSIFSE